MDPRKFRDISGTFATGVTVITTRGTNDHPVGMTANSFSSLSLSSSLVLINIGKDASLYHSFMRTEYFAVNILSAVQEAMSRQFFRKNIDRFEGAACEEDVTKAPILKDTLAYFDCIVLHRYDGGDHTVIIGETKSGKERDGDPLLFYKGKYVGIQSNVVQQ